MKHLKHPATIIAAVALFVAFGGGAAAYASGLINGSQITNHSISAKKMTKSAVKSLHGLRGKRGPAGPAGATGATGATGAAGATGPQGPGGKIVDYNATATASPTFKTLGTFLGETWSVECVTSSGDAELAVEMYTTDGSFNSDLVFTNENSGSPASVSVGTFGFPAGSLTQAHPLTGVLASAAAGGNEEDTNYDIVQEGPATGHIVWHGQAVTQSSGPSTCHASFEYYPEPLTGVSGTPRATAKLGMPMHLGNLHVARR
jgi:hypothetical protein